MQLEWYYISPQDLLEFGAGVTKLRHQLNSIGDIDRDGEIEIVTGGNFEEQNCVIAQLCIWNGFTFMLEDIKTWSYSDSSTITYLELLQTNEDEFPSIITCSNSYNSSKNRSSRSISQISIWGHSLD